MGNSKKTNLAFFFVHSHKFYKELQSRKLKTCLVEGQGSEDERKKEG